MAGRDRVPRVADDEVGDRHGQHEQHGPHPPAREARPLGAPRRGDADHRRERRHGHRQHHGVSQQHQRALAEQHPVDLAPAAAARVEHEQHERRQQRQRDEPATATSGASRPGRRRRVPEPPGRDGEMVATGDRRASDQPRLSQQLPGVEAGAELGRRDRVGLAAARRGQRRVGRDAGGSGTRSCRCGRAPAGRPGSPGRRGTSARRPGAARTSSAAPEMSST